MLLFVSMADWNNETDSIVRECKLRTTLRSKWNKAGEQRQGNQYNNLQNCIGGNVEVKVKAEAPIIAMRALIH